MKESEYEFVYQSALQEYLSLLSVFVGGIIGVLPFLALTDDFFPALDLSMVPERLRAVVLVACCVLIVVGLIVGIQISTRFVSTGTLQLRSDYAILHYHKKTVQLKKNEFRLIKGAFYTKLSFGRPQKSWTIRLDGHDIYFSEALLRKADGRGKYDPSLGQAMTELEASGLPTMP